MLASICSLCNLTFVGFEEKLNWNREHHEKIAGMSWHFS